ncbi:MAG: hypothetical protein WD029_00980 [Microthrixaceae bacterium]
MKASTKRYVSTGALMGMVAVFSTGCTLEEVLTITRILGLFL